MEENCRVIELFGLPGCGKTTICQDLFQNDRFKGGTIGDVMSLFHKKTIINSIKYLPIKSWWRLLLFIISIPLKKTTLLGKDQLGHIKSLFYITLAYSFAKDQKCFNYLFVDHGVVQELASLTHVIDFQLPDNTLNKFILFLNSLDTITFVYCKISSELALDRIRTRKRDSGRIDAIINEEKKALNLLNKEDKLFLRIVGDNNISIVDMSKSKEDNCKFFLSTLNNIIIN